jgi:hypothetical protein
MWCIELLAITLINMCLICEYKIMKITSILVVVVRVFSGYPFFERKIAAEMDKQGKFKSYVSFILPIIIQNLKELLRSQHRPIRCRLTSLICAKIAVCRT